MASSTVIVVGAGQAGAQAVDSLRREGFLGRIILVGEESELPYQRPPLSKAFLAGKLPPDRLLFRHQTFYDEHKIEIKLGHRATALYPKEHELVLANGERLRYDQLLLCLGASSRHLTGPGSNLKGIYYLRSISDVNAFQSQLVHGKRMVIIGGGYIGLETAATARHLGCEVTVLEMADRVMNRVVASIVSKYFEHEHRKHGVQIICDAQIVALEGADNVRRVVCANGAAYEADLVIAGVGAIANVELASQADIECANGIVVDEYCHTSAPDVFAAGDCTNHPSLRFEMRVRLESVDNAVEQAKSAVQNMLNKPTIHNRVPWFWSDQFDNKLHIVGLSYNHDQQVTRGDPADRTFSVCYLKGGELVSVESVNNMKDFMSARKLIPDRNRPIIERLADASIALKDV